MTNSNNKKFNYISHVVTGYHQCQCGVCDIATYYIVYADNGVYVYDDDGSFDLDDNGVCDKDPYFVFKPQNAIPIDLKIIDIDNSDILFYYPDNCDSSSHCLICSHYKVCGYSGI